MIRAFRPSDVLTLHRLRKQGVYLDNRAVLTWGTRVVTTRALASPLSKATGVFTGVQNSGHPGRPLIGQASHTSGASTARLTFLAPEEQIELRAAAELIEYLLRQLGEHQAQTLLAEVDEEAAAFEVLRQLNFSIYARQQIWKITSVAPKWGGKNKWRICASLDGFNIRKLHFASVPSLVQQIEARDFSTLNGWVYYQDTDLLGFAEVFSGPRGAWVLLFCHPEMDDIEDHLSSLLALLRPRARRPVYLCIRRYQHDLSSFLQEIGAQASNQQAVMARRLTAGVTHAELSPIPQLNGTPEVPTPIKDYDLQGGEEAG
ncbi:MAG: hypothetical protein JW757_09960 [Anaerolineales bacterium]|nr:hypothetical protein [Anaerolineales bacterium]